MSNQIQGTQTVQVDFQEFQIEEIQLTPIVHVNSYSVSQNKQFLIISTQKGIIIVHNSIFKFKCYTNKNSPFWVQGQGQTQEIGVKLGALVQSRNEVAVVPNFSNKNFKQTHAYIFDYQMKCILHKFDFFLNIEQIWINQEQIFVSNKKRVIIYNYLNDNQKKNQKFYFQTYKSKQPNYNLRYFQTSCQDYEDQFTINLISQTESISCNCGKFYVSQQKPYTLAYIQTVSFHNQRRKKIWIYDEKYDTRKELEETLLNELNFEISLSNNGQFLAYTFEQGKKIKVYNLKQNAVYCILKVSSTIRNILKMEFVKVKIEGKDQLCLIVIRQSSPQAATLHIFQITKRSPLQEIKSRWRRYFPLFEQVFRDYQISETLLNPSFFVENNVLFIFSLCGIVFEGINFTRSGNAEQKTFSLDDYQIRWVQQKL